MFRTALNNLDKLPQGYRDALMLAGKVDGEWLIHSPSKLAGVLLNYAPAKLQQLGLSTLVVARSFASLQNTPFSQWPDVVKSLADKRAEGERGAGDTAERLLGATGEAFKALFRMAFGEDCRCKHRKDRLNAAYNYSNLNEENTLERP